MVLSKLSRRIWPCRERTSPHWQSDGHQPVRIIGMVKSTRHASTIGVFRAAEIQALASGHHPNSSINTVTLGAPINVSHQLRLNSGTFECVGQQLRGRASGRSRTQRGRLQAARRHGHVQRFWRSKSKYRCLHVQQRHGGHRRHAGDLGRCDGDKCVDQQRGHAAKRKP